MVARTPGREPSPREIAAIVKTAREVNVKVIFAEPQFPPKAAQVIAEECGAEVLFINPLGDPPDFVYLDTMEKNLLLKALERTHGIKKKAAELLHISFRSLRYRLDKHGIDAPGDE